MWVTLNKMNTILMEIQDPHPVSIIKALMLDISGNMGAKLLPHRRYILKGEVC